MTSYFRSIVSPAHRAEWEDIAQRDLHTLVFQTPQWTDGLASTGEYEDASRMYETRDGNLAVLPLVRRRALLPGLSTLASMPDGWGVGGLISHRPLSYQDRAAILADLSELPAMKTSLRINPLRNEVWPEDANLSQAGLGFSASQRETHILDLEGGFEQVWNKKFPTATRTKIRKGEQNGLEIQAGQAGELLDVYYTVYLDWIDQRAKERHMPRPIARRLGKLREPLVKFQAAAKALGPAFWVWIVRHEGHPIAGAITLIRQHQTVYWRSASHKELAGRLRANELLQKVMIEAACSAGSRYYHMGESGGVPSLKQFKEKFGAQPYAYTSFYQERLPLTRIHYLLNGMLRRVEQQFVK